MSATSAPRRPATIDAHVAGRVERLATAIVHHAPASAITKLVAAIERAWDGTAADELRPAACANEPEPAR